MLDAHTRLCPNVEEVAAKIMDGEAVLINLSDGMYYSMDLAGGLAWELIERHASIADIADALSARFAVERQQAEADIRHLAGELLAARLVQTTCGEASATLSPLPDPPNERAVYQTPCLNAYHDMAELLALDPPHPGLSDTLSKPLSEE